MFAKAWYFVWFPKKNPSVGSDEEEGLVTKLVIKLLIGCLPMYKKHIKMDVSIAV